MLRMATTAFAALCLTVIPAAAQQRAQQGQPPAQQQQQMQRQQEQIQAMERLMTRIHQTNLWMDQRRTHEQYRQLGQHMQQAGERLRDMLREMDRLHQTPDLQRDRDRLREFDRLRDRVQAMQRDLEQAHDALRKVIGQP